MLTFFLSANNSILSLVLFKSSTTETGFLSILFSLINATSRSISLILFNLIASFNIKSAASVRSSSEMLALRMYSAYPWMDVRGVLISCARSSSILCFCSAVDFKSFICSLIFSDIMLKSFASSANSSLPLSSALMEKSPSEIRPVTLRSFSKGE